MKGASKTLAVIALTLALIAPLEALALQTITISGGNLNNHVPTVYNITDEKPTWTATITPNLRWHNASSSFGVDFIYSSNGGIEADSGGINAYKQTGGWFQYIKVQLWVNGEVRIYFMPNSTVAGSSTTIFIGNAGTWDSNTGGSYPEPTTVIGDKVFVSVAMNKLYIGTIHDGQTTYWVNGFGLPSDGLGNQGVTHIGAYGATYTEGGVTTPCTEGGEGYVQVEFGESSFVATQSMQGMLDVIIAVVPIVVVVAVIGMVVRAIKGIGKKQ